MNTKKLVLLAATAILTYSVHVDEVTRLVPELKGLQWVAEAEAILGVRRRTRRRTAVVAYSAGVASGEAVATEAAASEAPPPPPAPAQPAPAPAPAQPAGAPPLGSIVTALPDGCTTQAISGIQYNNCNGVYYRVAFQGNNLVYVVSQP